MVDRAIRLIYTVPEGVILNRGTIQYMYFMNGLRRLDPVSEVSLGGYRIAVDCRSE